MKEQNGNENRWKDSREDKGNVNVFLTENFVFPSTRSFEACVETLYYFWGFVYRLFLIDCCSLENRCVRQ